MYIYAKYGGYDKILLVEPVETTKRGYIWQKIK